MDPQGIDLVTKLLSIGEGGEAFFVSCLLHLSPEDLKAGRLVNKAWNDVIKKRLWGNKRARKTLEEKLLKRWMTTNPETVELSMMSGWVEALFCNNKYVFCGMNYGNIEISIKVYCLTDGQWVKDLEAVEEEWPGMGWEGMGFVKMCGNESIVAAQVRSNTEQVLKIWSSKEEMGRLHSFEPENLCNINSSIKVADQVNKVAILQRGRGCEQLVVLQEGENNWETKTLESFPTPGRWRGQLAVEKDFVAVVGNDQGPDSAKVKLWKEDSFVQDIELPELSCFHAFTDVVMHCMQSPILVASGRTWSLSGRTSWVKVFQLAADNQVHLIKTVLLSPEFYGGYGDQLFCNGQIFGCQLVNLVSGIWMNLFKKATLLDPETGEQTERNVIPLPQVDWETSSVRGHNTTSLVFIRSAQDGENQGRDFLCKKDFWMSNTVS